MTEVPQKTWLLAAYTLLDALYRADIAAVPDAADTLAGIKCSKVSAALSAEYGKLYSCLEKAYYSPGLSMREYNTLRDPLVSVLTGLLDGTDVKLFYPQSIAQEELRLLHPRSIICSGNAHHTTGKDAGASINVCLMPESDTDTAGEADIVISPAEVRIRAAYCFPLDIFTYDRVFLMSKLGSLAGMRKNAAIALGGSSYAMVGFDESLMPQPAVNLAVNAQDPYYAFLSYQRAADICAGIKTIVIAAGYYFWHTDMSDNPSDYYRSVLSRVNYPVFGDLHNYKGEPAEPVQRSHSDPLLEKLFDFKQICDERDAVYTKALEPLPYYNEQMNKRPEYGMLSYPFRERLPDDNYRAAKARAEGHNRNYNLRRLAGNISLLRDFLAQMEARDIKVIILVPPVTKYYSAHVSAELRSSAVTNLEETAKEHTFTFCDLFENTGYDDYDFQDYDHLSSKGAQKLSKFVAARIQELQHE